MVLYSQITKGSQISWCAFEFLMVTHYHTMFGLDNKEIERWRRQQGSDELLIGMLTCVTLWCRFRKNNKNNT